MKKRGGLNKHLRKNRPNPARTTPPLESIEKMVEQTARKMMILEIAREIGYPEAYTILVAWKELRRIMGPNLCPLYIPAMSENALSTDHYLYCSLPENHEGECSFTRLAGTDNDGSPEAPSEGETRK